MPHDTIDYRLALLRFAGGVPALLRRHGVTAPLAAEVERLDLTRQLERKFTLAVVGRMRAGKSTLLNALMNRHLAPVGVNATTATINWFDHAEPDLESSFDVVWNDESRPSERWALERRFEFTGNAELAAQTRHLRFYAASDLLQSVRMVDTPGHDSLQSQHEAAASEFVRRQGIERADAIILALPAVVTTRDLDAVEAFARESRLPGQGPYNTVAVLQKWETLEGKDIDGQTWHAAEDRASRLAQDFAARLSGHVSAVLPVSGLQWLVARHADDAALQALVALSQVPQTAALERVFINEGFFLNREVAGVEFDLEWRRALHTRIESAVTGNIAGAGAGAYPLIKHAVFRARRLGVADAPGLRAMLLAGSRVEELLTLLRRRFFEVSTLIQAGSALNQALAPCHTAFDLLRAELAVSQDLTALQSQVQAELASGEVPPAIARYVGDSLPFLARQARELEQTQRDLHRLVDATEGAFSLLLKDIECLECLGEAPVPLEPALAASARRLFGQAGLDTASRLGLADPTTSETISQAAHGLLEEFQRLRWRADERVHRIAEHALDRINTLLDEEQNA